MLDPSSCEPLKSMIFQLFSSFFCFQSHFCQAIPPWAMTMSITPMILMRLYLTSAACIIVQAKAIQVSNHVQTHMPNLQYAPNRQAFIMQKLASVQHKNIKPI